LFNNSNFTGRTPQSHFFQETIAKLCPPSCLHVRWNSLNLLEKENINCCNINKELEIPFSITEMNAAVSCIRLKSAPSLDQIDYNIITSLPCEYTQFLLQLYNNILSEGVFPIQWRQFLVALIPKSGGTGVRPISLLSSFLKTMEKEVYTHIQWFIESRHIILDTQLSFRSDRSCINSLVILTSDIYRGFINNSVNAFWILRVYLIMLYSTF